MKGAGKAAKRAAMRAANEGLIRALGRRWEGWVDTLKVEGGEFHRALINVPGGYGVLGGSAVMEWAEVETAPGKRKIELLVVVWYGRRSVAYKAKGYRHIEAVGGAIERVLEELGRASGGAHGGNAMTYDKCH